MSPCTAFIKYVLCKTFRKPTKQYGLKFEIVITFREEQDRSPKVSESVRTSAADLAGPKEFPYWLNSVNLKHGSGADRVVVDTRIMFSSTNFRILDSLNSLESEWCKFRKLQKTCLLRNFTCPAPRLRKQSGRRIRRPHQESYRRKTDLKKKKRARLR